MLSNNSPVGHFNLLLTYSVTKNILADLIHPLGTDLQATFHFKSNELTNFFSKKNEKKYPHPPRLDTHPPQLDTHPPQLDKVKILPG
jgi:hypothetical protein